MLFLICFSHAVSMQNCKPLWYISMVCKIISLCGIFILTVTLFSIISESVKIHLSRVLCGVPIEYFNSSRTRMAWASLGRFDDVMVKFILNGMNGEFLFTYP